MGQGVASFGVTKALGWRVRVAHAVRFFAVVFAGAMLASVAPNVARAQFVCNPAPPPASGVSIVCTVTGNFTGPVNSAQTFGGGSATTINSGSVSGDISTTADGGGNATTNNSGHVDGLILTYTSNFGVFSGAGTATTNNSGSAFLILNQTTSGGNSVITNSGTVSNIQNQTIDGGFATTINSGTVTDGIFVGTGLANGGGDATLINYGKISGDVMLVSGAGLFVGPGNAIFTNYGIIDATSGVFGGVRVASFGGTAFTYNAGRIYGEVHVFAEPGGSALLSNAGLIDGSKSPLGAAINLGQPGLTIPTTLSILPGSRIIGIIGLNGDPSSQGSGTKINVSGHDVSSVLTFGGTATCGCPFDGLIETGATVNVASGTPYVVNGNKVAVLDPTSFAAQDRNVLDFTRTVLSAASSRLTSPTPISGDGSAAIGFAPSGNVARDMANDAFASIPALSYAGQDRVLRSNPNFTAADGTSVWAQGFGGVRIQNANGPNLRSVNQFYGGIIGLDKMVRSDMRLGGFVGGGNITSQIDLNSGRTNSDTGFGGIYGRYSMNNRAFLDFALLAGGSSNGVKRTMTNNRVAGGYEYANANYSGWFISPELAYGIKQDLTRNWTVTPTARVRYLGANFGGYQESGSSNNLTVAGRTTHNFEERGEFVFTRTTSEREGSLLQINATIGALAWQRAGDAGLNTILLGQALAFATPGKANVFGGYAGGGFNWRQVSGFSVFGAAEVTAMSDSSHAITGHGGVKLAF